MALTVDELIDRDGPACVWCGRAAWRRDLTCEHVVPRSRGGHLVPENALVACRSCNRRRGSRPVDAYVRQLLEEGRAVNVPRLRTTLDHLTRSPRRRHRDEAARQLRRLASVYETSADADAAPRPAVTDLEKSLAFYTDLGYEVVGEVPETSLGHLTMLKLPGDEFVTLELVSGGDSPGLSHLVVQTTDLADDDGMHTTWITDPDGHRIELVQWCAGHPDGMTGTDFTAEP